jgi:hypothetical protein
MPHITLPEEVPGPRGSMLFRSEVGPSMSELAEILMRGSSTLTPAERELIGAKAVKFCGSVFAPFSTRFPNWSPGLQQSAVVPWVNPR